MRLRFQKGDLVAIAAVLMLAVAVLVAFLPGQDDAQAQVEIYRNGQRVKTLPLSQDDSFTLEGDYTNLIVVENGRVRVAESTCPGKDCVHSGSIGAAGRSLVCLPNGVEIRIVGKADGVDFAVG